MGNQPSADESSPASAANPSSSKKKKEKKRFFGSRRSHASSTPTSGAASASASSSSAVSPSTNPGSPPPASASSSSPAKPIKLGLEQVNFINVHKKDYTGRVELVKGNVMGLSKADETDVLFVYLKGQGKYKARNDSAMAAINRLGLSLERLEEESMVLPSYRRHYHCWLSRRLKGDDLKGFEYKRLLVYEDPGEELTKDDRIVLDVMKCLATVCGNEPQTQSVMIPLVGAMLSKSHRKHFVQACTKVAYFWLHMGLPIRQVRILLPDTDDTTAEAEIFQEVKAKCEKKYKLSHDNNFDVFFSYAEGDKESASEMIEYLRDKNPAIRIYDAKPREISSVKERGIVDVQLMEAISTSSMFISLLSDDYFHSIECTEAFSLASCRDNENQGSFVTPLFWKSCDLTPLARRLVETEGVDCREANFDAAKPLLDEILIVVEDKKSQANAEDDGHALDGGDDKMQLADKLMMQKDGNMDLFEDTNKQAALKDDPDDPEHSFFDEAWKSQWATPHSSIVFGPRIGAGGFGEVYKCKWNSKMVAVKTLQKIENEEDPQGVYAEFMVEMKLMSKLDHENVVTFLAASVQTPRLAIILEFMQGGSLYRAIHRRRRENKGPFPLLKSLWIAYGIAKGMCYLHGQLPVVVHRDLKSPNILLGRNVKEVKVTDFGLSRLRVNTFVHTGPGGTPEWMAPELLRQDPFCELSDVFSFGVILWELMMCEKPWKDDHPMQIVFKVGSRGEKLTPPSPDKCIPEVREMIVKCFLDNPKERPTFAELADNLNALCHRPEFSGGEKK